MAHTSRCSNARTDRCNCSCNGTLHGGGNGLVRAVAVSQIAGQAGSPDLWPGSVRTGRERRAAGRSAAMSRAKAEIKTWLAAAAASPPGDVPAATDQAIGMISDAVADAVVKSLNQNGFRWTEADHILCDFLAAVARAMQEVQDHFEQAVTHVVSAVLTARDKEHRSVVPEPLAEVASQAAINALMRLSAAQHFDNLLRATRVLAVMTCPDPEHHRAVVLYCLNPLEKDIVSDVTRQQLTDSLPRGWITPRPASIN